MATTFVRGSNPVWFMVDLVGQPLDDTYYLFVLSNVFPYLPSPVYHDSSQTTPWNFPIQFLANGTLPVDIFYNPDVVYRLEVRHGNTQFAQLIYEIDNYMPDGGGGGNTGEFSVVSDNQISNPQFRTINFVDTLSITAAGTYSVAPGWDLVITGSGTATVTQTVLSGSSQQVNNPPFFLKIITNSVSSAVLRQRLSNNGGIWSSTPTPNPDGQVGAILGSLTARATGGNYDISMTYVPSNGTPKTIITTATIDVGSSQVAEGSVIIPPSTNADLNTAAFIDINIQLQGTGTIELSNIQVIGETLPAGSDEPDPLVYQQETIERGIDHLFHYYKDPLMQKPIPSHLVAWDFPLNPAQEVGDTVATTGIGVNKSKYVWDQTILFQSAESLHATRGTAGELVITTAADAQMAVIQYLDAVQARKILNDAIAVNLSSTSVGQSITATISLWYTTDAALPDVSNGSNDAFVKTLSANGKPLTFNGTPGNWFEVPRTSIGQDAVATITTSSTTNFNDYNFNGWNTNGIAGDNTATFFAIVIGTATVLSGNALHINSVGLMSGDIATRPAPQTPDEVIQECRYYFEKSYDIDGTDNIGAASTFTNQVLSTMNSAFDSPNVNGLSCAFTVNYQNRKRAIPIFTFYSPSLGTSDLVDTHLITATNLTGSTKTIATWDDVVLGRDRMDLSRSTTPLDSIAMIGGTNDDNDCFITYHYTADSRLGIV